MGLSFWDLKSLNYHLIVVLCPKPNVALQISVVTNSFKFSTWVLYKILDVVNNLNNQYSLITRFTGTILDLKDTEYAYCIKLCFDPKSLKQHNTNMAPLQTKQL